MKENKYRDHYCGKLNNDDIGKTVKVLFEEFEDGYFKGHTTNYMMIKVPGKEDEISKFVNNIIDVTIEKNDEEKIELIGREDIK